MWFSRWQNYHVNGLIEKAPCIADSPTNPSASVHFQSRQCPPTSTRQRLSLFLCYLTPLQRPVCRTLQDMSPLSQRRQRGDRRPIQPAVRSSCNSSELQHRPIRSLYRTVGVACKGNRKGERWAVISGFLWQSDRCFKSCDAVNLLTKKKHQKQSEKNKQTKKDVELWLN